MATAPKRNSSNEQEPEGPRWLGSVARRGGGLHTSGDGWVEPEQTEKPRWLGSVARRGERIGATEKAEPGDGSAHPLYLVDLESKSEDAGEESKRPSSEDWQGSGARALLNEKLATEPEVIPEPPQFEDELGERRNTRFVVGALGMRLRVVA
jgi:hypothetical protein